METLCHRNVWYIAHNLTINEEKYADISLSSHATPVIPLNPAYILLHKSEVSVICPRYIDSALIQLFQPVLRTPDTRTRIVENRKKKKAERANKTKGRHCQSSYTCTMASGHVHKPANGRSHHRGCRLLDWSVSDGPPAHRKRELDSVSLTPH